MRTLNLNLASLSFRRLRTLNGIVCANKLDSFSTNYHAIAVISAAVPAWKVGRIDEHTTRRRSAP